MKTEAQQWSEQAEQDLQTVRILEQTARYGPCAFYCQQVAEKALKSTLYQAGQRPWGHSIPALLDQICAVFRVDEGIAPLAEVTTLDEHYMRPRYPDARSESELGYDKTAAQEALKQAQTVLAFAKGLLK